MENGLIGYTTLYEALKRTKVVRNRKPVVKFQTDRTGYRVKQVDGRPKEVKMTPQEQRKRKLAGRVTARKAAGKQRAAARKRAQSMKRRTW